MEEDFDLLRTESSRRPWSVTELNAAIKGCLEEIFPSVWVAGEITDLSQPRSGHIYFTLKDENAQVRGVIWRSTAVGLPFRLEDGMSVLAQGQVQVYGPRGTYQLCVRQLEPQGEGALQLAFRQLQRKLAAEGLFDPERKKTLPRFPRRIAFVTSPTGAAIRDFLAVAQRRWRGAHILVIPARVQGAGAAEELVRGVEAAQKIQPPLDAVVIGRGGGSMEDLWCFNDERLVRAVARCRLPTISAVGHEIDVTLCDLAADQRALTPTEAAERLLPSGDELRQTLVTLHRRLRQPLFHRLEMARNRLTAVASRPCFVRPREMFTDRSRYLDELEERAKQAVQRRAERARERLRALSGKLEALSPLAVLSRGYSMTRRVDSGSVVTSSAQLRAGDLIVTSLQEGQVRSQVIQ